LDIPSHAEDGGEEAELAGVYIIAADGSPFRIGMAQGNEFSDHLFEKRNYLNLAGSKLRTCSLGPELVIGADFTDVPGHVRIERGASTLWQKAIASGEYNMAHSLANLEHHHFKFAGHRQPGSVHVHFYGATRCPSVKVSSSRTATSPRFAFRASAALCAIPSIARQHQTNSSA